MILLTGYRVRKSMFYSTIMVPHFIGDNGLKNVMPSRKLYGPFLF